VELDSGRMEISINVINAQSNVLYAPEEPARAVQCVTLRNFISIMLITHNAP